MRDEIDRVLATHYGFTEEELDFIPSTELRMGVNYDTTSNTGWDVTRKRTKWNKDGRL